MKPIIDHHHYKKELVVESDDLVARYERYVVDLLLSSDLPDDKRDSSVDFELMHHHSTAQFARLIAQQRGLPVDICTIGAILHDIYVIKHGSYSDHAHKGVPVAKEIIEQIGGFSDSDVEKILSIVRDHSDKHITSDNHFSEFGKDVDVLDSFLYPGAFGYYLKHKSLEIYSHYVERARRVWRDLNIPIPREFSVLDNFGDNWFDLILTADEKVIRIYLSFLLGLIEGGDNFNISVPSFCVQRKRTGYELAMCSLSFDGFMREAREKIGVESFEAAEITAKCSSIKSIEVERLLAGEWVLLVIWSVLNAYESYESDTGAARLNELGLSKKGEDN